MIGTSGTRGRGNEQHRIEAHIQLGLDHLIAVVSETFAQRTEAHEAAGRVIRILQRDGARHALARGQFGHWVFSVEEAVASRVTGMLCTCPELMAG